MGPAMIRLEKWGGSCEHGIRRCIDLEGTERGVFDDKWAKENCECVSSAIKRQ
jgi:hypothetical protein